MNTIVHHFSWFNGELKIYIFLVLSLILNGCGMFGYTVDTCEELAFYEYAQGGKRIEVPDDLDSVAASKELIIPDASPRPERDLSAGCIDKPPTLKYSKESESDEE